MCRVEQKRETLQNISQSAGTLEGYQIVSWVLLDSPRKCSFGASAKCTPIDYSHNFGIRMLPKYVSGT